MKFNIAIVGATGAVGEALIDILASRDFPVAKLDLLASARSAGEALTFGKKEIEVTLLDDYDFAGTHMAFFSAGSAISAEFAPKAAAAGCLVIDNTSKFRYDDDVPLVVPEVNGDLLEAPIPGRIIANPNCSTIQLVVALAPLHRAARITRIIVATYQSVSGAGRKGVTELARQTTSLLAGTPVDEEDAPFVQADQIAFNVVPQIGRFDEDGMTFEEVKMIRETRKILRAPELAVNPTCVRVPVFYGHSEAVTIETERPLSANEARRLLRESPGIEVLDREQRQGYPTAVRCATGTDGVYVGRIRKDPSHEHGLNLWVVSDNLRKGAALNSIQIAEHLIAQWTHESSD
ncbi:MAG: aspartate-semialdehyde dehydrogenase [Gammaproteobacteria bacterium]|nr:aspartate-semialdehyde dehydrogenase [Gammaproteobacteria bacterium]